MNQFPEMNDRIPADRVSDFSPTAWFPPDISGGGNRVVAQSRPVTPSTAAQASAEVEDKTGLAGYQDGFKLGREEGTKKGYEEGLAKGAREAREEAARDFEPRLKQLNQLLTSLANPLNEQDYELEQALFKLVQVIARGVIQHELKSDPAILMQLVREAIHELPSDRDHLRIYLNPSDKQLADEAIEQGGENWRAVADESITAGGCKIETDNSELDFSLETRVQSIIERLEEAHATCPGPGDHDYEAAPEPAVSRASPSAE